jgi:DNA-binding MarR family transcriptional regulator
MFLFSPHSNRPRTELSASKQNVLSALVAFEQKNGYSPTVRELSREVGSAVSTVHAHLESLELRGLAHRSYRCARGWSSSARSGRAA